MARTIEREALLDALPTRTLSHLARQFGVNGYDRSSRSVLKRALAGSREFSTEMMLTLLKPDDLERVGHVAGVHKAGPSRREVKARLVGLHPRPGEGRNEQPDVPRPAGYLLDTTPAARMFAQYSGAAADRLHVGEAIPLALLAAAAESFRIPSYEYIAVLYDNSLLRNAGSGFAIGEHGIYWRNPLRLPSARHAMAWHEFAGARIERAGDFEVRLGGGAALHMTFIDIAPFLRLLHQLQAFARDAARRRGMPLVSPDMQAVARQCRRYDDASFHSFRFGSQISEAQRRAARECLLIPDYEEIAVLCDDTVFQTCRRGFALGAHGIYWRNGLNAPTRRNALSWPELAMAHIRAEADELVCIGDGAHIQVEFLDGNDGAHLFQDLQQLVREAANRVAEGFGLSLDETRRLRRSLGRELRGPVAQPVAVARSLHTGLAETVETGVLKALANTSDRVLCGLGRQVSGFLHLAGLRG